MAVMSLTSSGIKDFFVQRVTAIIITIYFAYILIKYLTLSHTYQMNYNTWHELFISNIFIKVATLMTYVSIFFHAWIGLWIMCGDYVKLSWVSVLIMISFILVYIFCFFWLFTILFFD